MFASMKDSFNYTLYATLTDNSIKFFLSLATSKNTQKLIDTGFRLALRVHVCSSEMCNYGVQRGKNYEQAVLSLKSDIFCANELGLAQE